MRRSSQNKHHKLVTRGLWDNQVEHADHDAVCWWVQDNPLLAIQAVDGDAFKSISDDPAKRHSRPVVEAKERGIWLPERDLAAMEERFDSAWRVMAADHPRPEPAVDGVECEHLLAWRPARSAPVQLGYADLAIHYRVAVPRVKYSGTTANDFRFLGIEWDRCLRRSVFVEAKTALPSFGDLMRQVNTYRRATGDHPWLVVCAHDDYAERLATQGIGFLRFDPSPTDSD